MLEYSLWIEYQKDGQGKPVYESVGFARKNGEPVFPLSRAELLDERLDEAYLTIVQSERAEPYTPGTSAYIYYTIDAEKPLPERKYRQEFYIIAKDTVTEHPVGSGRYNHDLYLIERTKLLEGVLCQSLTFTNVKGKAFTDGAVPVIPMGKTMFGGSDVDLDFRVQEYKEPEDISHKKRLPTPQELWESTLKAYLKQEFGGNKFQSYNSCYVEGIEYATEITFEKEGRVPQTVSGLGAEMTVELGNTNTVTYKICYSFVDINGNLIPSQATVIFRFIAVQNLLPLAHLTVADCINRVLELAEPITATWNGNAVVKSGQRFTLDAGDEAKYSTVYAPEFVMTQCTLREQLRVIGGYIHAEPWLDGNDVVHFLPYGSTKDAGKSLSTYVARTYTQDINQFCTRVDTTASNLVSQLDYAQGVIFSPNATNYRTLRTESVYTRVQESTAVIATQFPIRVVEKVVCGLYKAVNSQDEEWAGIWEIEPVDITPYIVEKTAYDANLHSFDCYYPNSKAYAIWYAMGERNLGGAFYKTENAWGGVYSYYAIANILAAASGKNARWVNSAIAQDPALLAFQISYVPIYSARFSHEKGDGAPAEFTQPYNQSENLIETRYYGENVKGVAARLGNVEQEITWILPPDVSKIPEIGEMVDGYAISSVSSKVMPGYIQCTAGLSKDFNRISQYVGISQSKRVYEVSEREAYLRNVLIKDYIVVSDGSASETDGDCFFGDLDQIAAIFYRRAGNIKLPVSAVSAYGCRINYDGNGDSKIGEVMLPVVSSAFGNAMVFSWSYKDNYSAGEFVQFERKTVGSEDVSGYFMQDVPYGDYYGRCYGYNFSLIREPFYGGLRYAKCLPGVEYSSSDVGIGSENESRYLLLRKDSRETLSFNYEVEFVSKAPGVMIGSGLASCCPLVRQVENKAFAAQLYILPEEILGTAGIIETEITKFSRELPSWFDDIYWENAGYEKNNTLVHYSSPVTADVVGSSVRVRASYRIPAVDESDRWTYGWVIATPRTTREVNVEKETGIHDTEVIHEGGEILLMGTPGTPFPEGGLYLTPRHKLN